MLLINDAEHQKFRVSTNNLWVSVSFVLWYSLVERIFAHMDWNWWCEQVARNQFTTARFISNANLRCHCPTAAGTPYFFSSLSHPFEDQIEGGSTVAPHYDGLWAGVTVYPQHMCHQDARMSRVQLVNAVAVASVIVRGKRIKIEFLRLQH